MNNHTILQHKEELELPAFIVKEKPKTTKSKATGLLRVPPELDVRVMFRCVSSAWLFICSGNFGF